MKIPKEFKTRYNLDFNDQFIKAYDTAENTSKNVFITGKAGTGKSTLLKCFRENTLKNVVALAPTGVAAVNVEGQTIHSFFRFKPDITPETVKLIKMRQTSRRIYEKIDCLIIDEISMVRADLFDCIDAFLRIYGKSKDEPFGGVQVVFFGDLYQLPPVVTNRDREMFDGAYKSPYFFDAKSYKDLDLEFIEFDKIYRQKEEDFIRLLGSIRNRSATESHLKELNKRVNPSFMSCEDDFYIYLTTTNALADQVNQRYLKSLDASLFSYEGEVTGKFDTRSLPTHEDLDLKLGAQVMLLNNDNEGRWINGSIGKIVSTDKVTDTIEVELENGKIIDVAPFTWEMFKFFYNDETESIESESVGSFKQYPLKLAWAVTIHKSQGKTFSKVIVDIGYGTFAHGQAYVALSRCSNFDGLVLKRPIRREHILLDKRVVEFMESINKS
ncbi:MAG: PIF1 family DEAD/DEAH box helicase [Candidatus Zapsychrus exili]|nr:PIF1 family DEAD/DEAH box helicase [Candidatus Zapsychrus exili]